MLRSGKQCGEEGGMECTLARTGPLEARKWSSFGDHWPLQKEWDRGKEGEAGNQLGSTWL